MVLFGMLIGVLIILGIMWSANNPNLMYFVSANVIILIILALQLYDSKKSDDKLNKKIDEVLGRLDQIKARLDELSKR